MADTGLSEDQQAHLQLSDGNASLHGNLVAQIRAILVDGEDVLEGATSNVFVVCGDVLRTPAAGVLPGVTRGIVLELAADVGLRVEEGPLEVEALRGADEAFLTSSTREVMPIRAVDGAALGSGEVGPTARALLERYRETVPSRLD